MATAEVDVVELTVRCAFQTSKDIRVVCPLHWTIRLLKEHLHQVCLSHPAVTSQRLIFAGACLTDDMVIRDIMDQRKVVDGPQVFHLVCPLPQSSPTELRQRQTPSAPNSMSTSASSATVRQSSSGSLSTPNYYEWYRHYYGTPSAEHMARLQQYSDYYAAYINQWQGYHNYMMSQLGDDAFLTRGVSSGEASGQQMHIAEGEGAVQPNQDDVNMAAAAQPIQAEPNVAAVVPGGGRDILDIVYRVFRVLVFLSAVLIYSSIERFLAVITIALFILFVQLRRNQQRQARVNEPVEAIVNNNNAGEQSDDVPGNAQTAFVAPTPPSGIQLFFSTCYSFITSFFTSLVPDHPVPVDFN